VAVLTITPTTLHSAKRQFVPFPNSLGSLLSN
jgi:hypothetical protein